MRIWGRVTHRRTQAAGVEKRAILRGRWGVPSVRREWNGLQALGLPKASFWGQMQSEAARPASLSGPTRAKTRPEQELGGQLLDPPMPVQRSKGKIESPEPPTGAVCSPGSVSDRFSPTPL